MRPRAAAGAVAALTVGALLVRATQIDQSLFGDEVLAFHEVAGQSLGHVLRTVGTGVESSPPLFFILAWLSAKLGDPTVWIRLPSLLLGAATVPVVYALGRETIGRAGGVIGAAVTAASPFATYYGIEARPYATMEFFVAVSTLALVWAVRSDRRRDWALYAVAAAAAVYSHYTAIFVLGAQMVWALWMCRGRLRRGLVANAVAALLYVPWLPSLHGSNLGVYAFLEPLTAAHVLGDVLRPVAGYPYAPLRAIPTITGLVVLGACALAGVAAAAHRRRRRPGAGAVLIGMLALATPVGLLLYSIIGTDLWTARSLAASAPAQALALGALLAALPRRAMAAAVVATLAVLVFGTVRALSPRWARPPYRVVAAYLDRVAAPQDPILLYSARLVLDEAIPAQMRRPHTVIDGAPARWPQRPAGTLAFVVIDDALARALHTGPPRPPGWTLVAERHYRGLVAFSLFTYRAGA